MAGLVKLYPRPFIIANPLRYFMMPRTIHTHVATQPAYSVVDPKSYTDGRWLHRDVSQRDARYIDFNLAALLDQAVKACPGATAVINYEKKEGANNKVFVVTMDDNTKVVARLPTRLAGPRKLTTHSEVATLTYLALHTDLPIPKVLDWSDSISGPVGAEYIIMEHVLGVSLLQTWDKMSGKQHIRFIHSMARNMRKLSNLSFPAYGSLYFSDSPFLQTASIYDVGDNICIGPHCGTDYWDCGNEESKYYHWREPNRGPWPDLSSYTKGLIDAGYSRIPSLEYDMAISDRLPYQGYVQEHLDLLETSRSILEKFIELPAVQEASKPTMWHPDFHMRNLYVSEDDPTVITGIIDWQSTSIEPALMYRLHTPDFAQLPPYDKDLDGKRKGEMSQEEKDSKLDTSLCNQAFCVALNLIPNLDKASRLDENLVRLFVYCHQSWHNSATALRAELISISNEWSDLGLTGVCPYHPSEDELALHEKHYEDFETVQRLKSYLARVFYGSSDGWVPNGEWEAAKELHRAQFQQWMETTARGDDYTPEKSAKIWPWDER